MDGQFRKMPAWTLGSWHDRKSRVEELNLESGSIKHTYSHLADRKAERFYCPDGGRQNFNQFIDDFSAVCIVGADVLRAP